MDEVIMTNSQLLSAGQVRKERDCIEVATVTRNTDAEAVLDHQIHRHRDDRNTSVRLSARTAREARKKNRSRPSKRRTVYPPTVYEDWDNFEEDIQSSPIHTVGSVEETTQIIALEAEIRAEARRRWLVAESISEERSQSTFTGAGYTAVVNKYRDANYRDIAYSEAGDLRSQSEKRRERRLRKLISSEESDTAMYMAIEPGVDGIVPGYLIKQNQMHDSKDSMEPQVLLKGVEEW
eukprot:CAMPEP_0114357250 /NCGR_PEP_ID=MMETSP0101-20121206/21494_1 /TAXON_ID=38822 ORGANISM="Pteridomonas danica, Strain PT" /NCGR_SAMPLE_ID=MMETSP0101 /ASSEMBLY_ACC=CAM_ASM_000211 /LENGTH=235 /DNA_ID=CAMNT_0001499935 /DNA_START=233 /DNA_END=937 /DNA_ORIENTATION=-